jgi:hypothetical protein
MMTRLLGPLLPAREMPTGLYGGVFLSALFELGWIIIALATIGDTPAQAAGRRLNFGEAHFPLNSPIAWVALAGMIAITWGCRTGRQWARYASVVFWIIPVAARPFPTSPEAWAGLMYGAGFAACVAAYLFRNDAVAAYFARAEQARRDARPTVQKVRP